MKLLPGALDHAHANVGAPSANEGLRVRGRAQACCLENQVSNKARDQKQKCVLSGVIFKIEANTFASGFPLY